MNCLVDESEDYGVGGGDGRARRARRKSQNNARSQKEKRQRSEQQILPHFISRFTKFNSQSHTKYSRYS